MKHTTLVIMAAGIGSRFGIGIKQLEPLGPNGEIIMDYSVMDALEAGFDRIVFIIRKDLEADFREVIGSRLEKTADIGYAFQELADLPRGFSVPAGRKKPWGTGQAVLSCRGIVREPFAVINADDYYGREAFRNIHDYLTAERPSIGKFDICMAGFSLKNTLSDHGGVTRGICTMDEQNHIQSITETRNIIKTPQGAAVLLEDGSKQPLAADTRVSMNMWGLTPDFIDFLETGFEEFLSSLPAGDLTTEYLLPTIIDGMIRKEKAQVTLLETHDKWFGVTYQEDKPAVAAAIRELIAQGLYPGGCRV